LAEKIPAHIVKRFGLDDPNPNVRARNGSELLATTADIYSYSQNFLMAVEGFLPNGDEVRKQLEEMVEGMTEFESDKSKKLYLADKLKGLKGTLRKKPPAPSGETGGVDLEKLTGRELFILGAKRKK